MAIDTVAKRGSAIATRRLPWFRRFAPVPDGSITQADRQQVAFVYGGIAAGAVDLPAIISRRITITGNDERRIGFTGNDERRLTIIGSA